MKKTLPHKYLPKASKTRDFVILGSKSGFVMMISAAAALAIAGVIAIILIIRKTFDKEIKK